MDWSYVTGYFDGEGCVSVRPRNRSIAWYNNHRESLEAMRDFIGCGTIRTRPAVNARSQPNHLLIIARRAELLKLIEAMLPHSLVKHDQLLRMRDVLANVQEVPQWGQLAAAGIEEVTRLYVEEGMTQQMIADRFGVSQGAVKNMLKRHGVKARGRSDAAKQAALTSPAFQERNRKISEARKREWADPAIRAQRVAAIRAAQPKRIATRKARASK